jgi:hypothetical protein
MTIQYAVVLINLALSTVSACVYFIRAMRDKTHWRYLKFAFAANLAIVTLTYLGYISKTRQEPILMTLSATMLLFTLAVSGFLGRPEYDRRNKHN